MRNYESQGGLKYLSDEIILQDETFFVGNYNNYLFITTQRLKNKNYTYFEFKIEEKYCKAN